MHAKSFWKVCGWEVLECVYGSGEGALGGREVVTAAGESVTVIENVWYLEMKEGERRGRGRVRG